MEPCLAAMSLREKVGQLFVIRPDALEMDTSRAELEDVKAEGTVRVTDGMREMFERYPCGGFALFRKNLVDEDQLSEFVQDLHGFRHRPLLYMDEEGGRVARLGNHPAFQTPEIPPMEEIGATGDPEEAYRAGLLIGQYLRTYGLDVDFAPVADVNSNPGNSVIGNRSFGSDPNEVASFVKRYLDGLHEAGMLGCIKHFPGHGDTSSDTHTGYVETQKTWDELLACELIPFRSGIRAGTDFIMTAHIAAPNVTGSREPSTVSHEILTEKLRNELGYTGLIITDALAMGAITQQYTSEEASVACLQAGADVLLMPLDYPAAFDVVMQAVEKGIISQERIDMSVRRVLKVKELQERKRA